MVRSPVSLSHLSCKCDMPPPIRRHSMPESHPLHKGKVNKYWAKFDRSKARLMHVSHGRQVRSSSITRRTSCPRRLGCVWQKRVCVCVRRRGKGGGHARWRRLYCVCGRENALRAIVEVASVKGECAGRHRGRCDCANPLPFFCPHCALALTISLLQSACPMSRTAPPFTCCHLFTCYRCLPSATCHLPPATCHLCVLCVIRFPPFTFHVSH
jgi:hypothetical protein